MVPESAPAKEYMEERRDLDADNSLCEAKCRAGRGDTSNLLKNAVNNKIYLKGKELQLLAY